MEDLQKMFSELSGMLQTAHAVQTMQNAMQSYDAYAVAAMQSLMSLGGVEVDSEGAGKIAASAWSIADAMMDERRKRGLGGFNPSDVKTDQVNAETAAEVEKILQSDAVQQR